MAAIVYNFRVTPEQYWAMEQEGVDAMFRYLEKMNQKQSS